MCEYIEHRYVIYLGYCITYLDYLSSILNVEFLKLVSMDFGVTGSLATVRPTYTAAVHQVCQPVSVLTQGIYDTVNGVPTDFNLKYGVY